jgi:hypothetical protein
MKGSTLLRVSIRNGLIAGLLSAVVLVVLYYIGRHPFLIAPFFDFRILLFGVFIFFSLKEFRDFHQDGLLYFWQGLFGSFIVVVVASSIAGLGLWIFGTLELDFVPDYVREMTAYLQKFTEEDLERARIGKETYERNLAELPATNITTLVITHFAQGMMIGFFISLILSVILRKTNQPH